MRLIVGLGNPGLRYKYTRHNIGFMIVEDIAKRLKIRFKRSILLKCRLARVGDTLLVKPNTFMNLSGSCVKRLVDKFKLKISDILVICDDLNLGFGKLRLRVKGSSGGHNGLASIIDSLGTRDFARLRIGIGDPNPNVDASDYVLSRFSEGEMLKLDKSISKASECALAWRNRDIQKVMAEFN